MVWSTSPLDVNKDITFDLFKIEPFILSWFQSLAQPFTQRWPGKTGERQKDSSFFHTFDPLAKVLQKRSEILVLLMACSRPPPSLAWVCAVSSQLVSWLPLCAHTHTICWLFHPGAQEILSKHQKRPDEWLSCSNSPVIPITFGIKCNKYHMIWPLPLSPFITLPLPTSLLEANWPACLSCLRDSESAVPFA